MVRDTGFKVNSNILGLTQHVRRGWWCWCVVVGAQNSEEVAAINRGRGTSLLFWSTGK